MTGARLLRIRHQLEALAVEESLARELLHAIEHDLHSAPHAMPWAQVVDRVGAALELPEEVTSIFDAAWTLLILTMRRLDSLQDADPLTDGHFARLPPALQYHVVLSIYLLATSQIEQLSPFVSAERLQRLRLLWHEQLFRAAGGQRLDLVSQASGLSSESTLASYQAIAHAKSGTFYALAFAGVAILASDDRALSETLCQVGELYGALVQFVDDVLDASDTPSLDRSLGGLLSAVRPDLASKGHAATLQLLHAVAATYREHTRALLQAADPALTATIITLFEESFGCLPTVSSAT